MAATTLPVALPHGPLTEVLPDLFLVTGTLAMPGPPMRFSRNMTVVRVGERLVIVNSVRLDDAGLAALDRLGKVTDVIRLAGFHGMDDRFYKDRYGATVSMVRGQRYTRGFSQKTAETYFTADAELDDGSPTPIPGASMFRFDSRPPEGLLRLPHSGGTLVVGDALQNWATADQYFNWGGRVVMRLMGFLKPHNVGPGWLKQAKPPRADLERVLTLEFDNVLPSHGAPVIGGAKAAFRPAIERAARRRP